VKARYQEKPLLHGTCAAEKSNTPTSQGNETCKDQWERGCFSENGKVLVTVARNV